MPPDNGGWAFTIDIGLLVVEWIGILLVVGLLLALFRSRSSEGGLQAGKPLALHSPGQPETEASDSTNLDALRARVRKLLTDEQFQNANQLWVEEPRRGIDILGSPHELGLNAENAIPVNGPIGELIYLSSLRVGGEPVIFHRLGSASSSRGMVDHFAWQSITSNRTGTLFLDFGFDRRSRRAPAGFDLATSLDDRNPIYGTTARLPSFPIGIADEVREIQKNVFGVPLPIDRLREFEQNNQPRTVTPPPLPPRSSRP
jgi:hypothetical protein